MLIFNTINDIRKDLIKLKKEGKTIGFVPTMGALHDGHISLIDQSIKKNDLTICSIFVNPLQFNDKSDLERYPHTPAKDIVKLEKSGCDILFIPSVGDIYPDGIGILLDIDLGLMDKVMEGVYRPGHFSGVVTVVKKLFDIIEPNNAYFGKKDFQQLAIIRYMSNQFSLPINIIGCEIVRESDGLAMSSRNVFLTKEERLQAPNIYKALKSAKEKAKQMQVRELKKWVEMEINSNHWMQLEYFEIINGDSLKPVQEYNHSTKVIGCIAVLMGKVRLIDNIALN